MQGSQSATGSRRVDGSGLTADRQSDATAAVIPQVHERFLRLLHGRVAVAHHAACTSWRQPQVRHCDRRNGTPAAGSVPTRPRRSRTSGSVRGSERPPLTQPSGQMAGRCPASADLATPPTRNCNRRGTAPTGLRPSRRWTSSDASRPTTTGASRAAPRVGTTDAHAGTAGQRHRQFPRRRTDRQVRGPRDPSHPALWSQSRWRDTRLLETVHPWPRGCLWRPRQQPGHRRAHPADPTRQPTADTVASSPGRRRVNPGLVTSSLAERPL